MLTRSASLSAFAPAAFWLKEGLVWRQHRGCVRMDGLAVLARKGKEGMSCHWSLLVFRAVSLCQHNASAMKDYLKA